MDNKLTNFQDSDENASNRKRDHIELALKSRTQETDSRFYYEPLLSGHPIKGSLKEKDFLGKTFRVPLWVSSMTGGTDWAKIINQNLARACGEFGFGMGLGSCRVLLTSDEYLPDFDVRHLIGNEQALYANLGIAQLEQLIDSSKLQLAAEVVRKLQADGLIIHVNPLQEWLQPEGDRFHRSPLEIIKICLDYFRFPIIVKEVGQGMGYESLKALFQLPIEAIDFAASGGTNFALLELLRNDESLRESFMPLAHVGHSALEMVNMSNRLRTELGDEMRCKQVIISGGIENFLDGYYLMSKLELPSVYGQASAFLKYARGEYGALQAFIQNQISGLESANAFLKIKYEI